MTAGDAEPPTGAETRLTCDVVGPRAATDLQVSRVGDVIVISADTLRYPAALSESEQAVARALIAGHTNAEIAKARGTSTKTVANQLYAMYRKLDVGTREELVALLVDGEKPSDSQTEPVASEVDRPRS